MTTTEGRAEICMNERIKELAKKAGINLTPSQFSGVLEDEVDEFTLEDFAELIVRECVAICQDIDGEDNIDVKSGRQDCAVEIREHFGVEE